MAAGVRLESDSWVYHIHHLAGGLRYVRECDVCNLHCINKWANGMQKAVKDDLVWYRNAQKSGKRTVDL
jgi:hypothetical protein